MVNSVKSTFSGFFSQLVVVCLLAVFIVLVLVAMYTTSAVGNELAWIGMTVEPLGAETAAALGIPDNVGGVIVGEVEGVAARAGIRHGDVVQGVNGKPIRDMVGFADLTGKIDLSHGGAQVVVNRRGVHVPVFVYPIGAGGQTPGPISPGAVGQVPAAIDRQWLGIEAETLTTGEARAMGIPAGVAGVIVDTVTRGGKAELAGLVNNDVIVSVNGKRTDSTVRLWGILAGIGAGNPVEFSVYRSGQLKFISMPTATGTRVGGFPVRGMGPGGMLVCPNCKTQLIHQRGVACNLVPCPSCGTQMIRTQ